MRKPYKYRLCGELEKVEGGLQHAPDEGRDHDIEHAHAEQGDEQHHRDEDIAFEPLQVGVGTLGQDSKEDFAAIQRR